MPVRRGSLSRVHIDDHVWTKDRIPWFDVADNLPRFRTNSSAVDTKAGEDKLDLSKRPAPLA